ncbi:hypothetical protein BV25DRAFT_1828617 [Artomyces pyxidatus]|uniref:Uncharacterized protein n=1 Tax=Artomyces pyxidatus TaxID=48021 RepID=A0ACB8SU42_9AGAM|nr:hypothetical protein BV25DRAFT_1828617 [Artomyces pyxidatus]
MLWSGARADTGSVWLCAARSASLRWDGRAPNVSVIWAGPHRAGKVADMTSHLQNQLLRYTVEDMEGGVLWLRNVSRI